MYILFSDGEIDDQDMEQLQELINVLDRQYTSNSLKRKNALPPAQNIYWDRLSYLAGLGFVMCQQYINVTYPSDKFERDEAFRLPPNHSSGYSIVQLVNAGANYWKHYQYPYGSLHKTTMQAIERLGLEVEYPYVCESILDEIVETEERPFSKLVILLADWRSHLIEKANEKLEGSNKP